MDFSRWNAIWSWSFGFLAVLITAGNTFTILIFSRRPFRKRCYALLISLAVADLLIGSLAVPVYVAVNIRELKMAKLFQCIDMFTGLFSIFTLAVISLERMCSVVFPFRHRTVSSGVYSYAIASPWVIVFLLVLLVQLISFQIIPLLYLNRFLITFSLVTPLVIICSAYCILWRKEKSRPRWGRQMHVLREKRLSNTLLIITAASLLTWLPFQIGNTIALFCRHPCSYPPLGVVCVFKFLQYSNSLVNVLIYPLRIMGFRKSLFKLFKPWNNHHPSVHPIPSVNSIASGTRRNQIRNVEAFL